MKMKLVFLFLVLISYMLFPQEGGKVSGQVFGDYFYTIQSDSGIAGLQNTAITGKKDSSSFQFRRINLNYDYTFSEMFFSRFRIESDQQANTTNNRWGIFVKDAFLRWNSVFEGSDFTFGIQPTPAYEISEASWGHRFLEKTIMDLRGIESSRDFALSLRGKFDNSGMFNYWIMAGNGSGNSQETNKGKKLYGTFFVKPSDKFIVSLFADYAFRPEKTISNVSSKNDAVTAALLLGYSDKVNFNIGTEVFVQNISNDISRTNDVNSIDDRNLIGLTLFATYNISDKLDVTARADYFDPDSDLKGNARMFYIAALDYKPHPMIIIAPNLLIETYENSISGRTFDPTITARLTVSWTYR